MPLIAFIRPSTIRTIYLHQRHNGSSHRASFRVDLLIRSAFDIANDEGKVSARRKLICEHVQQTHTTITSSSSILTFHHPLSFLVLAIPLLSSTFVPSPPQPNKCANWRDVMLSHASTGVDIEAVNEHFMSTIIRHILLSNYMDFIASIHSIPYRHSHGFTLAAIGSSVHAADAHRTPAHKQTPAAQHQNSIRLRKAVRIIVKSSDVFWPCLMVGCCLWLVGAMWCLLRFWMR